MKGSQALSVSADGSVVSGAIDGKDDESQGFRWSQKKGLQKFGSGWSQAETTGISDDGNVVVGAFWHRDHDPQAFYWTEREGVQSLAHDRYFQAMKLTDTAALGVSGDGSTIVGWAADERRDHTEAFRWTKAHGAQSIGDTGSNEQISRWMGVSNDGAVVAGTAIDGPYQGASTKAFRWTEKDGLKYLIPESSSSVALGMSSDGSKVFGRYNVNDDSHLFIWTKDQGVRDVGTEDAPYQYLVTDQAIIRIVGRD